MRHFGHSTYEARTNWTPFSVVLIIDHHLVSCQISHDLNFINSLAPTITYAEVFFKRVATPA